MWEAVSPLAFFGQVILGNIFYINLHFAHLFYQAVRALNTVQH